MTHVHLYDTTLRDGMGGHGMSLSATEKLRVVQALDRLGIHFIEAGFPASNPKEAELFELLGEEDLDQAQICAFGMTRRRDASADTDPPRLADGTLAGSALSMDRAVHNTVGLGVPVQRAVEMATTVPARALGLTDRGQITPGMRADLVALDPHSLEVRVVWLAGELVHRAPL